MRPTRIRQDLQIRAPARACYVRAIGVVRYLRLLLRMEGMPRTFFGAFLLEEVLCLDNDDPVALLEDKICGDNRPCSQGGRRFRDGSRGDGERVHSEENEGPCEAVRRHENGDLNR